MSGPVGDEGGESKEGPSAQNLPPAGPETEKLQRYMKRAEHFRILAQSQNEDRARRADAALKVINYTLEKLQTGG